MKVWSQCFSIEQVTALLVALASVLALGSLHSWTARLTAPRHICGCEHRSVLQCRSTGGDKWEEVKNCLPNSIQNKQQPAFWASSGCCIKMFYTFQEERSYSRLHSYYHLFVCQRRVVTLKPLLLVISKYSCWPQPHLIRHVLQPTVMLWCSRALSKVCHCFSCSVRQSQNWTLHSRSHSEAVNKRKQ